MGETLPSKGHIMEEYRICRLCQIHHIENCRTCFGFGVYDIDHQDGPIPVSANDAHEGDFLYAVVKCPECGSDERGYLGK